MARAIPLAPEDRAILDLEGPTIAGHTCKVVLVEAGDPDVDALRAHVAARIADVPQLTWRLGGSEGEPAWIPDPDFELTSHVTGSVSSAPLDRAGLRVEVARLFERRLDRRRPLWQMDLVPLRSGYALVWRIHHALADGTAAMRFARGVLWDEAAGGGQPVRAAHHAADDARRRRHLAGFVHRELSRSRAGSPFDGAIGTRRQVAFARIRLAPLHHSAKAACGATVNDAVLTVVAGALRRWLAAHHGSLGALRVKVPVSLHHDDEAGNRDSFFCVSLPLDEPDPATRLRAVKAETALRKAEHDAETMDELLQELGTVSPRLRAFASRVQASPRHFALNVSNVPGPRGPVSVLGAPVTSVHSIAEIAERHALRIAVVSVGGLLCFGFCADPDVLDDVQAMADGVEAEAAVLVE